MHGCQCEIILARCPTRQVWAENNSLCFIRLFYQPSQQLRQLQQWSSLACFHYILCKPWHLISLRVMGFERWGTRVAKPSSPPYMMYCTWATGCEKCYYVPGPPSYRLVSLSLMLTNMVCFFIYLSKSPEVLWISLTFRTGQMCLNLQLRIWSVIPSVLYTC